MSAAQEITAVMMQAAAEIEKLRTQRDTLLTILKTTAHNIRSVRAACNCSTYDVWLEVVEKAIADAEGGAA